MGAGGIGARPAGQGRLRQAPAERGLAGPGGIPGMRVRSGRSRGRYMGDMPRQTAAADPPWLGGSDGRGAVKSSGGGPSSLPGTSSIDRNSRIRFASDGVRDHHAIPLSRFDFVGILLREEQVLRVRLRPGLQTGISVPEFDGDTNLIRTGVTPDVDFTDCCGPIEAQRR